MGPAGVRLLAADLPAVLSRRPRGDAYPDPTRVEGAQRKTLADPRLGAGRAGAARDRGQQDTHGNADRLAPVLSPVRRADSPRRLRRPMVPGRLARINDRG